jgi:hypothetical protein
MGAATWESVEFGIGGRAVVDDGMESTTRGGCGGGKEAAPRGSMDDVVKRERLREGRRCRTMGGGVGERRVRHRRAGGRRRWYGIDDSWRLWRWEGSGAEGADGQRD